MCPWLLALGTMTLVSYSVCLFDLRCYFMKNKHVSLYFGAFSLNMSDAGSHGIKSQGTGVNKGKDQDQDQGEAEGMLLLSSNFIFPSLDKSSLLYALQCGSL